MTGARFNRKLDRLLARCGYTEVPPEQEKPASGNPARKSCHIEQVPPYCFAQPGMTPEESATAAANAMGLHADDFIARWVLLLAFRRVEGKR